jgi:hypothetical protein
MANGLVTELFQRLKRRDMQFVLACARRSAVLMPHKASYLIAER